MSLRPLAGLLGGLILVASALGVAAHFSGWASTTATLTASFTPLFVLAALLAAVLLLLCRYWRVAALALVVVLVGGWTQQPLYRGDGAGSVAAGPSIRVMQANIKLGQADPTAVVRAVNDERVDVLTIIELTPGAVSRLRAAGLNDVLPHSYVAPREGGSGAGIYSRFPLEDGAVLEGFEHHNLRAVVDVPGERQAAIYALHPLPPYPEPAWKWFFELKRLRGVFAAETLPLMVGADFNSTYDHRQYRDLLRNSSTDGDDPLIDAAEFLGSGIVATFPAERWYPPVLAIDKILVRGGTPVSFRRIDLPGSDHYGVLGDVRLDAAR